MDVPNKCIAKRTRSQCQKAEEELLKKARILKEERDKRKKGVGRSPEKLIPRRSSKDDRDEASSSDIELLDEKFIPFEQRKQLPKSKIAKRLQSIVIDETLVPSLGHDSEAANQNQRAHKHVGAPSRSNSVSTSSEDDFSSNSISSSSEDDFSSNNNEDDVIHCGEEYDNNHGKKVENQNDVLFRLESSSEEDDRESDDDYNEVESANFESESDDDRESDDDYNEVESANSESESDDDLSYCKEGSLGRDTDKDDEISNSVGKKVEYKEDEGRISNRTMNNESEDDDCMSILKDTDLVAKKRKTGNVHEESVKKRKVHGIDMCVNDTGRNYEVKKSWLKRLRSRTKLDSGKPSSPSRLSDNDAIESGDANESSDANELLDAGDGDHFVQKSSQKGRIAILEQSKRKNCQSRDTDFMKILADSIWEKGDTLKEKLPPLKQKDHFENALPLKFRFIDEDSASLEKDEEQREVDNLFADLEMGWTEEDIGSTNLSKKNIDDVAAKVTDPVESCRLGHHFLILDETIGVICRYCRIVVQEMKDILPDLKMQTRRRSEWFDFYNHESSLSFEFQFGESTSGYNHAFIDTVGPILNIIPAYLRRQMYPHQLDGFQFLWKKIAGATMIEDLNTPLTDSGTGCIISHAPGTGKSFLTIVFLLTFMQVHPTCRPVIMAPLPMLHAWANELKRWKVNIPFHNLQDEELSGEENVLVSSIIQQVGSSMRGQKQDKDYKRMAKLYSWAKGRSILGIGYKLFGQLAGEHGKGNYAEKFRKILLELPSIVILDEGHTARNDNSLLWKALKKVQTGRHIILSGTPFQNNTDELYNILCLVNPKFAESISLKLGGSDAIRKSNPTKGRWASLTSLIDENDDDAVEELRAMMAPFVHMHKGNIIEENLPGLRETLVVLNPTDLQKQLIQKILDRNIHNVLARDQKESFFRMVHLVSLLSVHPSLVAQHEEFSDQKSILEELEMSPEAGVKTQFVIEIIRLSNARGEKVLIFSEYIDPLNFLLKQLASYFSWEEGKQLLYMDGKLGAKQRQLVINSLNAHNSEAKVLLASTKASSEGINLVGASRVVLLDVVWNPSVERQAICRAYRLGQKKIVYVYRLIISSTVELYKCKGQAKKDRLSELFFPSLEGHNDESKLSGSISDDEILDTIVHHKKLCHIFEKILPNPKSNVFDNFDFVSSVKS